MRGLRARGQALAQEATTAGQRALVRHGREEADPGARRSVIGGRGQVLARYRAERFVCWGSAELSASVQDRAREPPSVGRCGWVLAAPAQSRQALPLPLKAPGVRAGQLRPFGRLRAGPRGTPARVRDPQALERPAERVLAGRVLAGRVLAGRVLAERVLAERVLAERVLAGRVLAGRVLAGASRVREPVGLGRQELGRLMELRCLVGLVLARVSWPRARLRSQAARPARSSERRPEEPGPSALRRL
ncbi:MAG: hypothetical protein HY791_07755 [Deltaproteobacteria bacterium]|nr:hypothetical protein [Deltaproteobacteria bacterium]